jgi:hypothetical protein
MFLNERRANEFSNGDRFDCGFLNMNVFLVTTDCCQRLLYNHDISTLDETATCQPIIPTLETFYAVREIQNGLSLQTAKLGILFPFNLVYIFQVLPCMSDLCRDFSYHPGRY